ncbi:MAG: DUF6894 family protein [Allosphingosinicella sp.]
MGRYPVMPRYFFDLHNDIESRDHEGKELPNLAAAREKATASDREMICSSIQTRGSVNLDHRIDVRDETGDVVMTVPFREAFTIIG